MKKTAKNAKNANGVKVVGGFTPTQRLRRVFLGSLSAVLFFILAITLFAFYLFLNFGVIEYDYLVTKGVWIIVIFIIFGVITGFFITVCISRLVLKPSLNVLTGIQKLSKGDYSARISEKGTSATRELAENFNLLAAELENTEILRSDFINNFSHEFKTPIVSMKGLVELLKKDDLKPEKRNEYLNIIQEELDRLSHMATNILNLSKIENQKILTDVAEFNISEQIRTCIVLLEKKWEKKRLDLSLDFGEFYYRGNEELLKQVFINLLDNAIKFSYEHGSVRVNLWREDGFLAVDISDTGETIPAEELSQVFNKFYRKDKTAMSEGNGIGLSIVSHIIALHKGDVKVKSENGVTAFTVRLCDDL